MENQALVVEIREDEARVNVTWKGENGDMVNPVPWGAPHGDILAFAAESIRNGGVIGITADPAADLKDFRVDPHPAKPDGGYSYNRFTIRPKTAFGV